MRVFEVIGMKTKYKTILLIAILIVLVSIIGLKEFLIYDLLGTRLVKISTDESESR